MPYRNIEHAYSSKQCLELEKTHADAVSYTSFYYRSLMVKDQI